MDWDKRTLKEWDNLGFYYEYDESLNQWRFFGSKSGLLKLSELIFTFASNPPMKVFLNTSILAPIIT